MKTTKILVGTLLLAGALQLRACGDDEPRADEAAAAPAMFYLMNFNDQASCAGFRARMRVGANNDNCIYVDSCAAPVHQIDLYREPGKARCHVELVPGDGKRFALNFGAYNNVVSTLWITLTNGHEQSSYGMVWATTIPDASRVAEIFLAAD